MADPALLFEKRGHVAYITLNRPEARNAMNPEMMVRLAQAWRDFDTDDTLRVAIITGAGDQSFCAGADLKRLIPLFTGARKPDDEWDEKLTSDMSQGGVALLRGFPLYKPVIAAVNGHCLAAGTELIQGTDIRVASDNATFGLTEVQRGIVPAGGGLVNLPRQVAYASAMEIILVGDSISAQEAHRIGMVNRVVPQAELMATAERFAERIAANGPLAIRKAKEVIVRGLSVPAKEAADIENAGVAQVMASEDAREGPRAFAEKRQPQFKGR